MKKVLLISAFLFVVCANSKAQNTIISITTLQELTIKSSNEFEDWGLMKGFEFSDSQEEHSSFNSMRCGIKNKYMVVKTVKKDGSSDGFVQYATENKVEYMNIKKNCTKFGYKFVKSSYGENSAGKALIHEYESKTFKLQFYTSPDDGQFDFNIIIINKSINKY